MVDLLIEIFKRAVVLLAEATRALVFQLLCFSVLALTVWIDLRHALPESRTNLIIYFLNASMITSLILLSIAAADKIAREVGIHQPWQQFWETLPTPVLGFVAIFGGLIGYWRHRLEHTRLLWPSHAIHHSDSENWLTLARFHPINRISTFLIDNGLLLLIGLPALSVNIEYNGAALLRAFRSRRSPADLRASRSDFRVTGHAPPALCARSCLLPNRLRHGVSSIRSRISGSKVPVHVQRRSASPIWKERM